MPYRSRTLGSAFSQSERVGQLARSDHAECPLIEGVHGVHRVAGVHVAADAVEPGEQFGPAMKAAGSDFIPQPQVGPPFPVRPKTRIDRAEKARLRLAGEIDEGGQGAACRSLQLGDDRADAGVAPHCFEIVHRPAAFGLIDGMFVVNAAERADQREFIADGREFRHEMADLHPRHVGGNRMEFAANLRRRIGLEIEGVDMRRTALQIDIDDRVIVHRAGRGRRFGPQQIGQSQISQAETADAQGADPEKISPRDAIAKGLTLAEQSQHGSILRG